MRTTLILDDKLLKEVIYTTNSKTKTEAITKVMRDFIRRKKMREIKSLAGKIKIDNNWRELENEELAE